MRLNIKKVITGLLCLLIVAAIVSLCSLAYFKETSAPESSSYIFTNVSVSGNTGFVGNSTQDNVYYVPISQLNSNTELSYSPTVTNNGAREIIAYIIITYPIIDNAGEYYSPFQSLVLDEHSNWMEVESSIITTEQAGLCRCNVYGYKQLLNPGDTTEPLCSKIVTNTTENFPNNSFYKVENGQTKIGIQTIAFGLQNPVDALNAKAMQPGYYNITLDDEHRGIAGILNASWNDIVEPNLNKKIEITQRNP